MTINNKREFFEVTSGHRTASDYVELNCTRQYQSPLSSIEGRLNLEIKKRKRK